MNDDTDLFGVRNLSAGVIFEGVPIEHHMALHRAVDEWIEEQNRRVEFMCKRLEGWRGMPDYWIGQWIAGKHSILDAIDSLLSRIDTDHWCGMG